MHPISRGFEAWEICLATAFTLWLLHIALSAWATIQEDGGLLPIVFSTLRSIPPVKAYIKQEKAKISEGIRESRRKAVNTTAGPEGGVEGTVDHHGGNNGDKLKLVKAGTNGTGAKGSGAEGTQIKGAAQSDGPASLPSSSSSSSSSSKALEPFYALPADSRPAGDVLDMLRCAVSAILTSPFHTTSIQSHPLRSINSPPPSPFEKHSDKRLDLTCAWARAAASCPAPFILPATPTAPCWTRPTPCSASQTRCMPTSGPQCGRWRPRS